MGPRHFYRGIFYMTGGPNMGQSLQWGHGISTVESYPVT